MNPIRLLVALALTLCVTRPSHAQSDRSGSIEGTVTDSVHARPLAGVRVVAVGVGSPDVMRGEGISTPTGAFRIDSLAPGRYMVGFESPLLDSLEIALPPRAVTIEPGRAATVDLAMPPAVKLRAAVCPGVTLPKGTGVVYGHVVSAETESPLARVLIALQWRELALWDSSDHKTLRGVHTERVASVTTDDDGWYRACGVPTGAWVSMQLQHEGRVGPVLRTHVDDTLGIAIRHLSLSSSAARDSGDVADSATAALTGTATLTGVVRDPTGNPVSSAEVRVRGARSAGMTDAQGSYTLSALPAGTHELEVRRIGYAFATAWVELRGDATRTSDVRLQRIVQLDSVRVVAMRTRYPEFQQRRDHGMGGYFLGPEEIARQRAVYPGDIIEKLPGFRVVGYGPSAVVTLSFGRGAGAACRTNIVIDGSENRMINELTAADVGAIEVYRGGPSTPLWYDRGCGTILVWTKR